LKRIGHEANRTGIDVRPMNRANSVRVGQVPEFQAFAFARSRALQLSAHGAIHEEDLFGAQSVEKSRHGFGCGISGR
jgi:hypothetical protein